MKIAACGHRPSKMFGYKPCKEHVVIKDHMRQTLKAIHSDITLISGCALGIDQWWMEIGILLKMPVIAAVPFEGFDSKWPLQSRKNLQVLLDECHEVKYVSEPGYTANKLQKRNEWMVDNCDLLVAYWDGSAGGTKNCIDYAVRRKKNLLRFDPYEVVA